METYHKINAPFKRHMSGPKKGKLMIGEWSRPEFGYLAKNQWEFTEKVDGTNIRVQLRRYEDMLTAEYAGRTDNAVLPKPLLGWLESAFPTYPSWRRDLAAPSYTERYQEIGRWMLDNELTDVTLFGEGYGPKIQGGGKYREDQSFVLFDVKIGDFWLDRKNVNDVADKLGIESVPVLGTGTLQDGIDIVSSGITFNDTGAVVRWGRGGLASRWGNFEAEGLVARPTVPLFNRQGERIIVKIKGKDFK